jgi:hypothetical protein
MSVWSGVSEGKARATPLTKNTASATEAVSKAVLLMPTSPFFDGAEERRVSDPRSCLL